jgi:hypothetical protein
VALIDIVRSVRIRLRPLVRPSRPGAAPAAIRSRIDRVAAGVASVGR